MRVFVPTIIGILVMVSLYQILPSERAKITEVVETTTTLFESIEDVSESKETTTTTFSSETTTTTEETSTTSTTILPGDPLCEELGCPYGTNFVGSKNSDKYHYCHCSYAKRIKPENLVCFFSEEEAIEKGYTQSSCQQTTTTTTSSTTSSTTTTETTTTSTTVTTTTTTSTTEELTTTTTTTILSGPHIGEIQYETIDKPENEHLDQEWVEIVSDTQINMTGWTLSDAANTVYSFPPGFNLLGSVKVHTGYGEDNSTDLYWNRNKAVWNNGGDTATLKDSQGNIIDQKSY